MGYTKGGAKPNKRTKNVAWYKKKYSVSDLAAKAMKGVVALKGIINSELKTFDLLSSLDPDHTGVVSPISAIARGDARDERNGKSVLCKSVFFRGCIFADTGATVTSLRVMIVQDTMNQGTTPTLADMLQTNATSTAFLSPLAQTSSGRFRVLYSKILIMNQGGAMSHLIKAYIQVDKHIKFTGPAGTDEWKNQIYLAVISDKVSSLIPHIDVFSRVSYYDN